MKDQEYSLTKEKILEVAKKQFLDNGFSNTTIRGIAKEADVNPALISYHFESKKNLALTIYKGIIYDIFSNIDLSKYCLNSEAENCYILNLISIDYLFKDKRYADYCVEMHRLDLIDKPLLLTPERCYKLFDEFKLDITDDENYKYLLGMKAIEREYLIRVYDKQIQMTLEDLCSISFSFYFKQLGFTYRQMDIIFKHCNNQYEVKYYNEFYGMK